MGLKKIKPTTPGQRFLTVLENKELSITKPLKRLTVSLKKQAGRNNLGRITVRHRGGGHKRKYRIIDFKRDKIGIPAKVVSIEYDPNRSSRIALLNYKDGEKRYILAPLGLKIGDTVISGNEVELKPGNTLPLRNIPEGFFIHNIELKKGKGGQIVRSAGTSAVIMAKEEDKVQIKLPSGEIRYVFLDCMATIGQVGNIDHENINLGKAGRHRWLGIRPAVRGVAMNPVDHPHGGGEGKSPIGKPRPVTPWGKPTLGFKTRRKTKYSDRFIVKRRKGKK